MDGEINMARPAVVDRDLGFRKIMKGITSLTNQEVVVGIVEGSLTHAMSKGNRKQTPGLNIAQYAAENEFGTRIIPQRSFMRSTFDENLPVIEDYVLNRYDAVVRGEETSTIALKKIGQLLQDAIKRKIDRIRTPPNSPRTIALKKSSKPLIDFGAMRAAVRYLIRRKTT